ncbi:hypothetical protein [Curtobacterium citreum]|uniref:hypothetical protein n=1 Tax=Curtobacterium citreum TaxID=2036 RepID=UPI0007368528|nr:hypothetical protein [Curtobacterium citreum]KTR12742.1 hypothetical protein NS330_12135 [Curtobacterium citreum]
MLRRLVSSPTRIVGWAGLAAALVGIVLIATAPHPTTGWFASAPLSDTTFVPDQHPWQERAGQALLALGAVVVAFVVGRLSAQRRP